jgi:glycosyltransferase involved in cell wall biosynthesis
VVVPSSIEGDREPIDLPNVSVNTDFAVNARSGRTWLQLARSLADSELPREFLDNLALVVRHPAAFRAALAYHVRSRVAESWMRRFIQTLPAATDKLVVCTWWFDAQALGFARLAARTGIRVATRAHGYDLYESRHSPPYIPFRRSALAAIGRVYPDSEAGARHLVSRFPSFADKIEVGLLGVEDPGFLGQPSNDGVFRIVSCSFLTRVKRIDLLIRGLAQLGRESPAKQVEWSHLGDGPERVGLSQQAAALLPPNVRWTMDGYPGKAGVYGFYRTRPVDLFVNVSQSEGTPVSIMEALSVGIPVLCTAVGGNIEAVGAGNGLLIGANPSPADVAAGITTLRDTPGLCDLRTGSRAKWEERYNARKNYSAFAESLLSGSGGADWTGKRSGR